MPILDRKDAFHQGLHYLLSQNYSSEKEIQFLLENTNLWPLDIYNWPSQNCCIKQKEESISA